MYGELTDVTRGNNHGCCDSFSKRVVKKRVVKMARDVIGIFFSILAGVPFAATLIIYGATCAAAIEKFMEELSGEDVDENSLLYALYWVILVPMLLFVVFGTNKNLRDFAYQVRIRLRRESQFRPTLQFQPNLSLYGLSNKNNSNSWYSFLWGLLNNGVMKGIGKAVISGIGSANLLMDLFMDFIPYFKKHSTGGGWTRCLVVFMFGLAGGMTIPQLLRYYATSKGGNTCIFKGLGFWATIPYSAVSVPLLVKAIIEKILGLAKERQLELYGYLTAFFVLLIGASDNYRTYRGRDRNAEKIREIIEEKMKEKGEDRDSQDISQIMAYMVKYKWRWDTKDFWGFLKSLGTIGTAASASAMAGWQCYNDTNNLVKGLPQELRSTYGIHFIINAFLTGSVITITWYRFARSMFTQALECVSDEYKEPPLGNKKHCNSFPTINIRHPSINSSTDPDRLNYEQQNYNKLQSILTNVKKEEPTLSQSPESSPKPSIKRKGSTSESLLGTGNKPRKLSDI